MNKEQSLKVMVADVGGTHTRVAVADGTALAPESVKRYLNSDWTSFEDLVAEFVRSHDIGFITGACIAIAGPVEDGRVDVTNSDWEIEADSVNSAIESSRTVLVNDLQALGHSLAFLDTGDSIPILEGVNAERYASRLVIGIGTGFNAALASFVQGKWHVSASECGHTTLQVQTEREFALSRYISDAIGFASVEDVLSGRGVETVYAWLSGKKFGDGGVPTGSVINAAAFGEDTTAAEAERMVVGLLGSACGDLALTHLPFGGIYLAGGVARALVPRMVENGFSEAFREKGRFKEFLGQFHVAAIADDFAALKGCAAYFASIVTD